jgi:hypothetical protein
MTARIEESTSSQAREGSQVQAALTPRRARNRRRGRCRRRAQSLRPAGTRVHAAVRPSRRRRTGRRMRSVKRFSAREAGEPRRTAAASGPRRVPGAAAPGASAQGTRRLARVVLIALAVLVLGLVLPAAAAAQPFGTYVSFSGTGDPASGNGYLAVPDSPDLDPAGAITLEGWVKLATPFTGCRSLIGKDMNQGYWLGVCGSTVTASFRGGGSGQAAGMVPPGQWTHVAVTYDGQLQSHYVNGELAGSFAVQGPLAPSAAPLEIGGDVALPLSPAGAVTELRLWSVARTVDEIRATINVALTSPQPGLVAVWSLGSTGADALGAHGGTWNGTWSAVPLQVGTPCTSSSPAALCLASSFTLSATWRTGDGQTGAATTVPVASTGSGLLWFFSPDEWEVMVKVIDGCSLNGAFWVFSAATTNVFYRLEVVQPATGITKIYFNYPGPPAPAVTDTTAFTAACP